MSEFDAVLQEFLAGRADFGRLDAALMQALGADPSSGPALFARIDEIFRSGRLPPQLFILMKNRIAQSQTAAAQPVPPPTPPSGGSQPSAADDDDEAADRTILRTGGPPRTSQPSGPAYAGPAGQPAGGQGPAGPYRAEPTGQHTGQQTGSHTGQHTGSHTGQQTGQHTGGTGTSSQWGGTGTSNWSGAADWTGQHAQALDAGSVLKGRFVLENVIGRGGMGVVFRARDLRAAEAQDRNPYVAIKVLNDEFRRHPESLKALQRESKKAQNLAHPNIATVFDFDRDGATVYIQMEFLEGDSLDRLIKSKTFEGLPFKEAYPLIRGLGRALGYAHAKGIVHSDFKPGNCYLTNAGVIKVFDFGIARAAKISGKVEGEMTRFDPGTLGALTPAYASCEMIDGDDPDPRDDIYALGCVSYELLTGRHPFNKLSATEARDKKLLPAPIKGLDRSKMRALSRALAFRREDRSQNVEAFLDELAGKGRLPVFGNIRNAAIAASAVAVLVIGIVVALNSVTAVRNAELETLLENCVGSNCDVDSIEAWVTAFLESGRSAADLPDDLVAALSTYFVTRVREMTDTTQGRYRFADAQAYLNNRAFEVTSTEELRRALEGLVVDRVNAEQELRDRLESNRERLLPDDPAGDDLPKVLAALAQFDPDHELFPISDVESAYIAAAEGALPSAGQDGSLQNAELQGAAAYITEGLRWFPGSGPLQGLSETLATLSNEQDRQRRLASLRSSLDVATFETLVELRAAEPDFDEFARLLRGNADPLIDQWASRKAELEGDAADMLAGVDAAIGDDDLDAAIDRIRAAETFGAAAGDISARRTRITNAFVSRAREYRTEGEFALARAAVGDGRTFNPEYSWDAEIDEINDLERADAAELADLQRARTERIRTGIDRIDAALAAPTFGTADVEAVKQALTTLRGDLDPTEPQYKDLQERFAGRIADEAGRLASQQNWQGVIDFAAATEAQTRDYGAWQTITALVSSAHSGLNSEARGEAIAAIEERFSAWLAQPDFAPSSLDGLVAALGEYAAEPTLAPLKEQVARRVFSQGQQVGDANLDDRVRLFTAAGNFGVTIDGLDAALRNAQDLARTNRDAAAARSRFERSQQSFATAIANNDASGAKTALDGLNALASEASSAALRAENQAFLTVDAPAQLAELYNKLAGERLAADEYAAAETLVMNGLAALPQAPTSSQRLTDAAGRLNATLTGIRRDRLATNDAAFDRMIATGPRDVADGRTLLASIEADAQALDSGWNRSVLNDRAGEMLGAGSYDRSVYDFVNELLDTAFEPASTPGIPCLSGMAGAGNSRRGGTCHDLLPDGANAPELVVVPLDSGALAFGKWEVTVGDWNRYCAATGCAAKSGDDDFPVTDVSLTDVDGYIAWLSRSTERTYRLPTADEWEEVASRPQQNNLSDHNCRRDNRPRAATSGQPNDWGLLNMLGNAAELVRARSNAIEARGGGWSDPPSRCSEDWGEDAEAAGNDKTGFRLVREELDG